MESVRRLTQAYSQAPWRKQLQAIVSFLLLLVLGALVAVVYLSVSARAVSEGHEIQELRRDIEKLERENADLATSLAFLMSASSMEERAREMGFRPVQPDEITYIEVPGYISRQEASLAPAPGPVVVQTTRLSPAFTESLIDWLQNYIIGPPGILPEAAP